MKVGILTFSYTMNAGSALQAYALKKTMENLGAECLIINYQRDNWVEDSASGLKRKFGAFFGGIAVKIYGIQRKKRLKKYQEFQKAHLDGGGALIRRDDLQQLLPQYDFFITGSDQVWNQDNAKVDGTYFLDFVNDKSKKISYAPSFGVERLSEEQKKYAQRWLSSFNVANISVREQQGVELVSKLIGYEPVTTLDPAFLLTQDEWEKISKPPKEKGYIFLYQRVDSQSICEFTRELSKETGLPIIQYGGYSWHTVGKRAKGVRPDDWVGYVLNADYIVTNSFHGIVFALNYRKQFFVEMRHGKHGNTNSRLSNILDQLQLRARVISEELDVHQEINYDAVIPILNEKRDRSINWLKDRLDAVKGGENN